MSAKRKKKPRFKPLTPSLRPMEMASLWLSAEASFDGVDIDEEEGVSLLAADDAFEKAVARAFSKKTMNFVYVDQVLDHLPPVSGQDFYHRIEDAAVVHFDHRTLPDGQGVFVKTELFCIPLMGIASDIESLFSREGVLDKVAQSLRKTGIFVQQSNVCMLGSVMAPWVLLGISPQMLYDATQKAAQALTNPGPGSLSLLAQSGKILAEARAEVADLAEPTQKAVLATRFLIGVQTRIAPNWDGKGNPCDIDILDPEFLGDGAEMAARSKPALEAYQETMAALTSGLSIGFGLPTVWSGIREALCDATVSLSMEATRVQDLRSAAFPFCAEDGYTLFCSPDSEGIACVVCDKDEVFATRFFLPSYLLMGANFDYIDTLSFRFAVVCVDDPKDLPKPKLAS